MCLFKFARYVMCDDESCEWEPEDDDLTLGSRVLGTFLEVMEAMKELGMVNDDFHDYQIKTLKDHLEKNKEEEEVKDLSDENNFDEVKTVKVIIGEENEVLRKVQSNWTCKNWLDDIYSALE